MDIERQKQGNKEINMIPMINVIFLLLIFFLVGGSIEKFEVVHIDVPHAESGKPLSEGEIVIILGPHDEVLVNDDFVENEDLLGKLEELLHDNKQRIITVKADANLPATSMIAILEYVKAAGGVNISIVTTAT